MKRHAAHKLMPDAPNLTLEIEDQISEIEAQLEQLKTAYQAGNLVRLEVTARELSSRLLKIERYALALQSLKEELESVRNFRR